MKARPILMSAPMVRALLDGRKTQTRRTVKPQPDGAPIRNLDGLWYQGVQLGKAEQLRCPYGQPGDLLWVRESFSYERLDVNRSGFMPPWHWADGNPSSGDFTKPKPSIHMPRWASRLTLELTDVRVERLQDISEEDALAEGVTGTCSMQWTGDKTKDDVKIISVSPTFIPAYRELWESINGKDSWYGNLWVWALSFRVHRCNVDEYIRGRAA